MTLRFVPRTEPLEATAAVYSSTAATRVVQRLLASLDAWSAEDAATTSLRALRAELAGGASLLLLLGPSDRLPWVPGVLYLGIDQRAPRLLLPTALETSAHPELVERALLARAPGDVGSGGDASRAGGPPAVGPESPLAVLPPSFDAGPALLPTRGARAIHRHGLEAMLGAGAPRAES